jgi:hypothetical protein
MGEDLTPRPPSLKGRGRAIVMGLMGFVDRYFFPPRMIIISILSHGVLPLPLREEGWGVRSRGMSTKIHLSTSIREIFLSLLWA